MRNTPKWKMQLVRHRRHFCPWQCKLPWDIERFIYDILICPFGDLRFNQIIPEVKLKNKTSFKLFGYFPFIQVPNSLDGWTNQWYLFFYFMIIWIFQRMFSKMKKNCYYCFVLEEKPKISRKDFFPGSFFESGVEVGDSSGIVGDASGTFGLSAGSGSWL